MDAAPQGLHTAFGELGLLCIIWAVVEVAWGASGRGVLRAKIASLSAFVLGSRPGLWR